MLRMVASPPVLKPAHQRPIADRQLHFLSSDIGLFSTMKHYIPWNSLQMQAMQNFAGAVSL
jgi:hypothetical protein